MKNIIKIQKRTFSSNFRNLKYKPIFNELNDRGFIKDSTSENLDNHLNHSPRTIYSGLDPTAQSLHVGHLLPLLACLHLHLSGHIIISLIGGATGAIGDPSGRSTERSTIDTMTLEYNIRNLKIQVKKFFENGEKYAGKYNPYNCLNRSDNKDVYVLDNKSWLGKMSLLEFLSTSGKLATIGPMLARDSVKNRMSKGITFTEFTYQLLQATDFNHLFTNNGCTVQIGGSDQWGNITAGVELIRRSQNDENAKAFGLTLPLLTTASGDKFGKSSGNAIWLNNNLTSIFDFYQFFIKTPDADVGKYLKLLTFLPIDEIEIIINKHNEKPDQRYAQKCLANEVTEMIHGSSGLKSAQVATEVLFGTKFEELNSEQVLKAFEGDSRLVKVDKDKVLDMKLTHVVNYSKQINSISQAKNLINAGGMYVNGCRITDANRKIIDQDIIDNHLIIIRTGKSSHLIIYIE